MLKGMSTQHAATAVSMQGTHRNSSWGLPGHRASRSMRIACTTGTCDPGLQCMPSLLSSRAAHVCMFIAFLEVEPLSNFVSESMGGVVAWTICYCFLKVLQHVLDFQECDEHT